MKTLNRLFLALLTVGMVTACSFGNSNGARDDKAEQEDRERFMQEYAVVFGVYEGTITTNPTQRVNLAIYPVDVPDGENSVGQPKLKMVAKARFRWLDSAQSDIIMDVRYINETSDIQLTRETPPPTPGAPPPNSDTFIVRGKLAGETLSGVVVRRGGTLGNLNLKLISRESSAPSEGDELERVERLRRLFTPFVGQYKGTVNFTGSGAEKRPIFMRLYLIETISDTGQVGIGLEGEYQRADDKYRDLMLTMAVEYRPTTNPPSVTMVSYPYTRTPNGSAYKITLSGTMVPGEIRGNLKDHFQAKTGEVTLKRFKQ